MGACRAANPKACWTSYPHEWQPLLDQWQAAYPDLVTLHEWRQFGGQFVRGLTIARAEAAEKAFRLLVTVPHAHEPASTAVIVDFACQLLTGKHRDGSPATDISPEEREQILSHALLTLIPDTNPQGRAQSPERFWVGKYSNDEFLTIAFGVAADGQRFGRYPEWKPSEHKPKRVGIEYEQIEEDLYVEPNTDRRSTHTRVVDQLFSRYRYTHYLEMHQHEHDETIHLPPDYDDLPGGQRAEIDRWANVLIETWRTAGAKPRPPVVAYRGYPRHQFFKDYWAGRCDGVRRIVSEVRNNRHVTTGEPTPLEHQFKMSMLALVTTVRLGLTR